jgi:hypothetical protein
MDVPEEFIDVRFDEQPEFTFGDLGAPCYVSYTAYEDAVPVLTERQIIEEIEAMDAHDDGLEWLVSRIYNQKQEGSCVANAIGQAHELNQAKQLGREAVIPLSAISLYKQIGRSASSGAVVSDGLDAVCTTGILPLDTPTNRELFGNSVMPNTGFNERYPTDWQITSAKLLGQEYHIVRTVNGLLTALANRDPVIVGREGHSICYVRPRYDKSTFTVDYSNSWGSWGFGLGTFDNGFGRDTLAQIKKSAQYAFALRSVKTPLLDTA